MVDMLAVEGRASVTELARRFAVSDDTVRRDLQILSAEGVVSKLHGVAVALDVPAMAKPARNRVLAPVKRALGRAAAQLVRPGMTLMLDAGETILAVAAALPEVPLTVITHSLDVAALLADRPEIRLILGGGVWNRRQRLFEGPTVEALVASCRADLAFLGACSIDLTRGVTATDAGDAEVKRSMIASSSRRILVADHTKRGIQPWFVAPLSSFDVFFTDRPVDLHGPVPEIRIAVL
jgi:DeoR family glycerol-3-phosphate regulon repressor